MAPAPMTLSPEAANVAIILKIIFVKVFNLPSYSNDLYRILLFSGHCEAQYNQLETN